MFFLNPQITVFLTAVLPISELRGAIPLGIIQGLSWPVTLVLAWLGNMLGVIIAMLFLEFVHKFLSDRSKLAEKFFDKLFARTHKRFYKRYEKWGSLALIIFVAIPLPITGGYTGAIAAFLFKIPKKQTLGLISLGVLIAGIIVTFLTKMGLHLLYLDV